MNKFVKYEDPVNSLTDYSNISIITSRDCTLRCTYCYLHKHADNFYEMDKILEGTDKLLNYSHSNQRTNSSENGVILEFYPEPWVNIPRTNKLILETLKLLHKYPKFHDSYMVSLGTNGLLLDQEIPILKKLNEKGRLSIAVTVDGIEEQHDLYRVTPNGKGSWKKIVENVRRYKDEYNIMGTKVTIGPDTIKYIYDSVLYLWNDLGLDSVNINVVFENLWGNEDEKAKHVEKFNEQLSKLYDYITENRLWEKNKYVSFLGDRHIPMEEEIVGGSLTQHLVNPETFKNSPYCGAAVMRSVDTDGQIYPCFRLSPYSLNQESPYNIDKNKFIEGPMRGLHAINGYDCSYYECLDCPILSTCHMCFGGSYEEESSVYHRTMHHCEFHKLEYKWASKLRNYMNKDGVE
jgi:uncharacterized protein